MVRLDRKRMDGRREQASRSTDYRMASRKANLHEKDLETAKSIPRRTATPCLLRRIS